MKIISWNVAGIRACMRKGLSEFVIAEDADIYCLQEVKATRDQFVWPTSEYKVYLNTAQRMGYSGTLIATKIIPVDAMNDIGPYGFTDEGRVIICEYEKFYLLCCYTPNSKELLTRLPYRLKWEAEMRKVMVTLDRHKPVILCGDLNVCHQTIDIWDPVSNRYSPGFSEQERDAMTALLSLGFVDVFRQLYPGVEGQYSYWSYRGNARSYNHGWRLDYFIISRRLMPSVRACEILSDVEGSDHCPIILDIDL